MLRAFRHKFTWIPLSPGTASIVAATETGHSALFSTRCLAPGIVGIAYQKIRSRLFKARAVVGSSGYICRCEHSACLRLSE